MFTSLSLLGTTFQTVAMVQQVVLPKHVQWTKSGHGRVPVGAIPLGKDKHNEVVYIARAYFNGSFYVGRVASHLGNCRIVVDDKEIPVSQYEVLTVHDGFDVADILKYIEAQEGAVSQNWATLLQTVDNTVAA
jgi:hypothetical protein